MVLDTSALLAVLFDEPERRAFNEKIAAASPRLLSAVSFVEASIVLAVKRGDAAVRELDLFLARAAVEIVPLDADQGRVARRAYSLYGKERHPAGLNFGDCFAYALAKTTGEPLLFKGNDFTQTDVLPA